MNCCFILLLLLFGNNNCGNSFSSTCNCLGRQFNNDKNRLCDSNTNEHSIFGEKQKKEEKLECDCECECRYSENITTYPTLGHGSEM